MKLTTHLNLEPRLRISGSVPLFLPSYCGQGKFCVLFFPVASMEFLFMFLDYTLVFSCLLLTVMSFDILVVFNEITTVECVYWCDSRTVCVLV